MNNVGSRFAQGLLIGFGVVFTVMLFSVIGAVIYFVVETQDSISYSDWEEYSDDAKVVIKDSRRVIRDGSFVVLGTMENQGEHTWQHIFVEVELFGEDGVFLDECTESLQGKLAPGMKENFKISCSRCKDLTEENVSSHEVKIKSASYSYVEEDA